jgi:3-methyladenine DNA glycosylase/8-oxoguanine DNA glycosylase
MVEQGAAAIRETRGVLERRVDPGRPVDLRLTLGPLQRGRSDPCTRVAREGAWRATRTPDGAATVHVQPNNGGVTVRAWGPGAAWMLDAAPDLLGASDDASDFEPAHPVVRDLHRRLRGLRLARTGAVIEALVPSILEQKVTGAEAKRSYARIVRRYGEPAPGPFALHLPPDPARLAALPYWAFHPLGVERRRADAIRHACARAPQLERAASVPAAAARRLLMSVPGIGPWTAAEVGIAALGDADAVSVGDYHIPHHVAWVLAGEPRGSDERMLELLAPFAGHRGRVIRLIEAGTGRPPRRAPRARLRAIEEI